MSSNLQLRKEQIQAAVAELNQMSLAEYGDSLESVLLNQDPIAELRVQRLVGIVLKRKFAKRGPRSSFTATGASQTWPWADSGDDLVPVERNAGRELALLRQLRMPGPWNERKPLVGSHADTVPLSWSDFKDDAENERGLFKILALYVIDKFNQRETKKLQQYLDAPESRRFEAGLDLATLLFDAAVTDPLTRLIGIPTLAVGVALVGIQYGYRMWSDPTSGRVGDSNS